jgi:hypothetical protein
MAGVRGGDLRVTHKAAEHRTVARMGVLGEMFPGRKIQDESAEAGDGQEHFQLGPIDLDNRTVQVQRVAADEPEQDDTAPA